MKFLPLSSDAPVIVTVLASLNVTVPELAYAPLIVRFPAPLGVCDAQTPSSSAKLTICTLPFDGKPDALVSVMVKSPASTLDAKVLLAAEKVGVPAEVVTRRGVISLKPPPSLI